MRATPVVRFAARLLLAASAVWLAACGGGDAAGPANIPANTPANTPENPGQYPGIAAGEPVTVQIGPSGGTVQTADGGLSLAIPAGALAKVTSVTVRPLVNTAPNGLGISYHIEPAGLKFSEPATITLKVNEAALGSMSADAVGIGLRNKAGAWFGDVTSTTSVSAAFVSDAPAASSARASGSAAASSSEGRVVSVTRVESSDGEWAEYTLIAFWVVLPREATVDVSGSTVLRVLACLKEVENGSQIDSDQLPALPICQPSVRQGTWRVNGIVGGNASVGVVSTDRGSNGAVVLYIAPNAVPTPNPVTVIASMYWPKRNVTKVLDKQPVKITIVGNELVGTATGTVSSAIASVGAVYAYEAKITWTREGGPSYPGVPVSYRPRGYVKYIAKNRCVSNIRPDSVPISPSDARLQILLADSTWSVDEGAGLTAPLLQYYDTCAKMNSVLEISVAPYIWSEGDQKLPVQGTIDVVYGAKIKATFSYAREGEARIQGALTATSRVAPVLVRRGLGK
jgi:hypothetical protein